MVIDQLLNYVVTMPLEQQKGFLVAMYKTQQKQVNNYVICKGKRREGDADNWPLIDSDKIKVIEKKIVQIWLK